ncbi:hypothetical protein ZWY2020_043340 [Hordeum vulgare]|nr:hypothetical protein ZWY2020_043340 [Hordeum vulgare]
MLSITVHIDSIVTPSSSQLHPIGVRNGGHTDGRSRSHSRGGSRRTRCLAQRALRRLRRLFLAPRPVIDSRREGTRAARPDPSDGKPGVGLPGTLAFDGIAVETCEFMLPSMMRDKYEALKNYGLEESEATIFQSGAKLGRQLGEIEDATRRWKVLADFWCEMMLYVAPSDNVNEHFEQLVQGGEFITHLWALLSHAGILERGQDQRTTPGLHPRAENTLYYAL